MRWIWIAVAVAVLVGLLWWLDAGDRENVVELDPAAVDVPSPKVETSRGDASRSGPVMDEASEVRDAAESALKISEQPSASEPVLVRLDLMMETEQSDAGSGKWAHGRIHVRSESRPDWEGVDVVADAEGGARLQLPVGRYHVTPYDAFVFCQDELFKVEKTEQEPLLRFLSFERAGRVSGRVVSADGSPVLEARVAIEAATWLGDLDPMRPLPNDRRFETRTDDRGRFTIDHVDPEHFYALEASHQELGSAIGGFLVVSADQVTAVPDVVLEKRSVWTARVVDPEGHPVAGASLDCVAIDPERNPKLLIAYRETAKTDDRGRASLSGPKTDRIELRICHEDHATWQGRLDRPTGEHAFTLEPGHELEGAVVGRDPDDPRPAGVTLQRLLEEPLQLPPLFTEALVDPSGQFRFDHLPAGRYELTAEHCRSVEVELPSSAPALLECRVRQLTVEILGPDGSPYPETCRADLLSQRARRPDAPSVHNALRRVRGEFELRAPFGRHTLVVFDEERGLEGSATFDVLPDVESTPLVIRLEPESHILEGRAVWAGTGEAVPDCDIRLDDLRRTVRTDERGRFRVTVPRTGAYVLRWSISFDPASFACTGWQDVTVDSPDSQVLIEIPRPGAVSGHVLVDGLPPEDAEVTLRFRGGSRGWTTETGRYRFKGIPAGAHVIHCRSGRLLESREVTVIAGEETTLDFGMQTADLGSISGTVRRSGEPLQHAEVSWTTDRTTFGAKTDGQGLFHLEDLPPGPGALVVRLREPSGDMIFRQTIALAPAEERRIDLDHAAMRVVFRVRDANGALRDEHFELAGEHPALGRISLPVETGVPVPVPPGRYRMRGLGRHGAAPAIVEVREPGELEISFSAGVPVDIVWGDVRGISASARSFFAFVEGSPYPVFGPVLSPGTYEIWGRPARGEMQRVGPIRVEGGEPLRFEFPIRASGTLRLVSESGAPTRQEILDERGHRLTFLDGFVSGDRALPPGAYRIRKPEGDTRDFVIRPNRVTVVETD